MMISHANLPMFTECVPIHSNRVCITRHDTVSDEVACRVFSSFSNLLYLDWVSSETILHIPKHHLTEVLNTAIGKNFFQFVNAYRVEAVKAALSKKDNLYSIEAIGYDCGFSSKSSFFTVFKKMTGMTPLQYRQSQI